MTKNYWVTFGSGNPVQYAALGSSVIFLQFGNAAGLTLVPPGITEIYPGWYRFQYDVGVTNNIIFTIDGGATLGPSTSTLRFLSGILDPTDNLDSQIGSTNSTFGTTLLPGDVFGYVKRTTQFLEGQQTFNKSTGTWDVFSKGSSTLLVEKTLTNSVSGVTAL
jgi:hypothetical protein